MTRTVIIWASRIAGAPSPALRSHFQPVSKGKKTNG